MGPGHFGVALVAKPLAPKAPLWSLLVASETLDLLCFGFISLGIEKTGASQVDQQHGIQMITPGVIFLSHGLLMSLVWSAAAGAATYLFLRDRRASPIVALVVFSHWILDFIVHQPDLPLAFAGSTIVGLGLWGSGLGLILSGLLEILLIAGGLYIYIRWHRMSARKSGRDRSAV